jgi:AraC-like DNA-binding protein
MSIIYIPEDLQNEPNSPIQLIDYQTSRNYMRRKVKLTKNIFSFILKGTKEVVADHTSISIDNREFLFMKSENYLMTEHISDNGYESVLLLFTDQVLLNFLEKNKDNKSKLPLLKSFCVCQNDPYIRNFVQSLKYVNQFSLKLRKELLLIKFEEIMTYLAQKKGMDFLLSFLTNQDNKIRHFNNVIESNRLKTLTIQELSFLCNMSVSTFKRNFNQIYQTTPKKWFTDQRLDHSAFLLSTQKKRPIELYDEIGYESLSNFTQAFKKRFGITPKQFQLEKMNF